MVVLELTFRAYAVTEFEPSKDYVRASARAWMDIQTTSTLDDGEKTIPTPGDRWWPPKAKQDEDKVSKHFYVIHGKT